MIAYNLIRQVVAEAAIEGDLQPWQISFKGTMSTVVEMLPVLGAVSNADEVCEVLLACCRRHTFGDRPDRYERRVLKRRPKQYKLMQMSRRDCKMKFIVDWRMRTLRRGLASGQGGRNNCGKIVPDRFPKKLLGGAVSESVESTRRKAPWLHRMWMHVPAHCICCVLWLLGQDYTEIRDLLAESRRLRKQLRMQRKQQRTDGK